MQARVSDDAGPAGSRSGRSEGHDDGRRRRRVLEGVRHTAVEDTNVTPVTDEELGGEGELSTIKGDIIVKFNGRSFRCKVKTGQDGLEDFMQQIRQKCGIPEEKMANLNLTYRCKDPNTGSQMTLEGVNESAFDAAVLCSAAQDKIKQQKRQEQQSEEQQQRRRREDERQRRGYVSTSSDEDQAIADLERERQRDSFPYPDGVASAAAGGNSPEGYNLSSARDRRRFERISGRTSVINDNDRSNDDDDDGGEEDETAQQQQQQHRAARRTSSCAPRFTVPSFPSFWRTTAGRVA